jgi:hypothetical protein
LKIFCRQKVVDPFEEGDGNHDDPAVKEAYANSRGDTEQCSDAGMTAADLDLFTVQQANTGQQEPR